MTDVAAAWFMTTMSGSKVMTALVQTASALPAFLLALPGGALVDLVDRRRWLPASQPWMVASVGLLALTAFTGSLSPVVLLVLAFGGGVGFAMRWPVFSALVSEVVLRDELRSAMGLHAVAVNVSLTAGPVAGARSMPLGEAPGCSGSARLCSSSVRCSSGAGRTRRRGGATVANGWPAPCRRGGATLRAPQPCGPSWSVSACFSSPCPHCWACFHWSRASWVA
jgi:MFS family permease